MTERFLSGFNPFVLPFLFGMIFVLGYCFVGMIKVICELPSKDRKRFLKSLVTPTMIAKNIKDIFCDCLFHVRLWKRNKLLGYMHSSIAFGWFMIIVIGHVECFLYTPQRMSTFYYPIFFRFFVAEEQSTMQGAFFFFLMDFFLLIILSGIVLAIIKRARSRLFGMRKTTNLSFMDYIGLYSLWCIFPLRLIAEGFTADISGGSFLTKSINMLFHTFIGDKMHMLPTWWAYSLSLGIFMVVLPFTRYMHIPAEMLLIPLRNAGIKVTNPRKGFAKVQVQSCPSCGVCLDACPMSVMKAHTKDATVYLNRQLKKGNEQRIEEISDKCLLCGKCGSVCQVQIKGDELRMAQRSLRHYDLSPNWDNVPLDTMKEVVNQDNKVIYFAGCMTSLTPSIYKSMESVLSKAGVDYVFMDKGEALCCGRPLMTACRYKEAKQLIEKNTEIILSSKADTLLLSCPICYRIFSEKYKLDGIRVVHHSVYFNELIQQGRLPMMRDDKKYVYHDPCELGRGCGIYEEPRQAISSVGKLVEAEQHHDMSICCGGSLGSLTLSFDQRKYMTVNALDNLKANDPDEIVTACPLCKNSFARYSDVPVVDLSEIIDRNTQQLI